MINLSQIFEKSNNFLNLSSSEDIHEYLKIYDKKIIVSLIRCCNLMTDDKSDATKLFSLFIQFIPLNMTYDNFQNIMSDCSKQLENARQIELNKFVLDTIHQLSQCFYKKDIDILINNLNKLENTKRIEILIFLREFAPLTRMDNHGVSFSEN